jgi:hypothetical protein
MPHINSNRRTPAASAVVLVLLLACLGLAACGGSSKSSSTSTNASAATTTTTTTTTGGGATKGPNASRFAAVRACLQKNGITLPKLPAGKRPVPGASPGGAGGFTLPKGMSTAQYEAVVKKCGGLRGGAFNGGSARFSSPVFKAALAKFATCLRQNGVNVPTPNTSGKGPVFSTKGINPSSAQFRTAETKCRSALVGAFRRGPGGGGGAPNSGAGATPPAG